MVVRQAHLRTRAQHYDSPKISLTLRPIQLHCEEWYVGTRNAHLDKQRSNQVFCRSVTGYNGGVFTSFAANARSCNAQSGLAWLGGASTATTTVATRFVVAAVLNH